MHRFLFLDVDGVCNSTRWLASQESRRRLYPLSHFDPAAVALVDEVCARTGAEVVVSSSWRLGKTVAGLQDLFRRVGLRAPVVCKTGVDKRGRGVEVRNWLVAGPPVESFVILDDFADMAPLGGQHVKTDAARGITEQDAERAVALLSRPWRGDLLLVGWR